MKREDDANSRERLAVVEKDLAHIKEESNALKARWKQEKEAIAKVRELKERIERLKLDEQEATRKGDYDRAGRIKYGELPQLEAEVTKLSAAMDGKQSRMLKEEVDEEDVAKIISKWTRHSGIEDAGRRSEEAGHHGRPAAGARGWPG